MDEIQRRPDLFPPLRVLADLGLDHLYVLYPGVRRYPLDCRVTVVPLDEFVLA